METECGGELELGWRGRNQKGPAATPTVEGRRRGGEGEKKRPVMMRECIAEGMGMGELKCGAAGPGTSSDKARCEETVVAIGGVATGPYQSPWAAGRHGLAAGRQVFRPGKQGKGAEFAIRKDCDVTPF